MNTNNAEYPNSQYNPTAPESVPQTEDASAVVGTGAFFGLELVFAIPLVGLIVSIILSFAPKNRNLRHYAQAKLIWAVIELAVTALLIFGIHQFLQSVPRLIGEQLGVDEEVVQSFIDENASIPELMEQVENIGEIAGTIGQLSEIEGVDELLGQLGESGDLEELLGQLETGDLEEVLGQIENIENLDEIVEKIENIENLDEIMTQIEDCDNMDEIVAKLEGLENIDEIIADMEGVENIEELAEQIDDPAIIEQIKEAYKQNQ